MTMKTRILLFVGALLLTACAAFGVPPATTFNTRALAATNTVQVVAKQAITMRAAGKLSDADRDNVVATLRTVEGGIDIASKTGDITKLDATVAILTSLQTYLATKEQTK
jgi:cbb3-type cytochrome oxidase cytochrome c subunit